MTRLVLVENKKRGAGDGKDGAAHRTGANSEGEAAKRLLEASGYPSRRQTPQNGQYEFACPFHEDAGEIGRRPTNFYIDSKTSQYFCQAASCGERGNLQTLEHFFGVDLDPNLSAQFRNKDLILTEYQAHLTPDLRKFIKDKQGLRDEDIDRFRLGWDPTHKDQDGNVIGCYVIPYLEGRRPVAFRFYSPTFTLDENGKKIYGGPNGSKYWWERADRSIVPEGDDSVLRLFNAGAASGDDSGRVYVCEGEFKAMLMTRAGYAAVSVPGATTFKPEWAQYFMAAKEVVIVMDNDNPEAHRHAPCNRCHTETREGCVGHNPGQEAAAKLVDFFGYRAKNVVLPLAEGEPKTDINEFIVRDGHTFVQFMELIDGPTAGPSQYVVRTLAQIRADPPPEAVFLVDQGLLPKGGRLLVTGAPKSGKSIFVENMVLSIASGIPFLHRFNIANTGRTPGHRVLILDRELSKRSLLDRFEHLIDKRPGYAAAEDKLLIDHDMHVRLDNDNAAQTLINLIQANNAEVVVFDTAYKFFGGDMENAKSVAKAFATLDEAIQETGVSVILTHHLRKSGTQNNGKDVSAHPDQVMGSFLWTGWPNGTVMLNFKDRRVENPFNTVASFVAFRDAAPPDPLLLMRDKDSIYYNNILEYHHEEDGDESSSGWNPGTRQALTYDNVSSALLSAVPCLEDEFLHQGAAIFGCKPETLKIHLLDILDRHPDFERVGDGSRTRPYSWKYRSMPDEETYDQEQARLAAAGEGFADVSMFEGQDF